MGFREWLELNEAGFLSRLLGRGSKGPSGVQASPRKPDAEEERRARDRANYDATLAMLTGRKPPGESAPEVSSAPYATAAKWPAGSSGSSPMDELRGLVGRVGGFSGFLERIMSRSDGSLKDAKNKSDMYDVYYKLSKSNIYKEEAPGLSDGARVRAISIIEGMFEDELGQVAFPDEEFVCPYGSGVDLADYQLVDRGEFEACAKVLVKGFRGGRTIPARVTYGGMTEEERERFWTAEQRERLAGR